MSASIFNTLTMRLTSMKPPSPLSPPPDQSMLVYDWVVRSGSYENKPARLYLTARLPQEPRFPEPYEVTNFTPDVLVDIPPETTLKDMSEFTDTGATMIQFFTMPRNNTSVILCSIIIFISLACALMKRSYAFAAITGLSISLTICTVFGGGANQNTRTIQQHTAEIKQKLQKKTSPSKI